MSERSDIVLWHLDPKAWTKGDSMLFLLFTRPTVVSNSDNKFLGRKGSKWQGILQRWFPEKSQLACYCQARTLLKHLLEIAKGFYSGERLKICRCVDPQQCMLLVGWVVGTRTYKEYKLSPKAIDISTHPVVNALLDTLAIKEGVLLRPAFFYLFGGIGQNMPEVLSRMENKTYTCTILPNHKCVHGQLPIQYHPLVSTLICGHWLTEVTRLYDDYGHRHSGS
jgi:hypothetical protein